MAIDMFLKVDGVTGESKDTNHKNWTDALSFNWAAIQPGNMSVGGGGGAGKVIYRDLIVQAFVDKATPAIMKYCASGRHVARIELSVCKAGGSQVEYSRVVLEDAMVSATEFSGVGQTDAMLVNYHFQAAKVNLHYWEQQENGARGAEVKSGWDIKQNKEL